jgi:hypothetical protein
MNDLTGWTPFTTSDGTLGTTMPTVVPFTSDGTSAEMAEFEVGQAGYDPGLAAGGGIQQTVQLGTGQYTLSADVAFYNASTFANAYAGEAILLIDSQPVYTYTIGALGAGQTATATLNYTFTGNGQETTIAIEFLRPALSVNGVTPYELVGDIDLEDPPGVAPEPGTWMLLGPALALLAVWGRKRPAFRRRQVRCG